MRNRITLTQGRVTVFAVFLSTTLPILARVFTQKTVCSATLFGQSRIFRPVTAEIASSSLVVPAIFSKY
jgi:hypothetical protein